MRHGAIILRAEGNHAALQPSDAGAHPALGVRGNLENQRLRPLITHSLSVLRIGPYSPSCSASWPSIGLSSAWRGCGWPSGPAPAIEAPARLGIFPKTVAVPGGYRGVRLIALLVPRAAGVRACGAIDAAGLWEALRQAAEERHHGRRGHLRSGHKAEHAVRADQGGRATELSDASSRAPSLHSSADCGHQLNPRTLPSSGSWPRSGAGASSNFWKSSLIQPTAGSRR